MIAQINILTLQCIRSTTLRVGTIFATFLLKEHKDRVLNGNSSPGLQRPIIKDVLFIKQRLVEPCGHLIT